MRSRLGLAAYGLFALLPVVPLTVYGQDRPADSGELRVFGEVVDRESGDPIPRASIRILSDSDGRSVWSGQSSEDGDFRTSVLPVGEYRIEVAVPPFLPLSEPILLPEGGTIDVRVELVLVGYELEPVVAAARRRTRLERDGFYNRLERGFGTFVTRAEIDARDPLEITDLLRGMRGVRVSPVSGPGGGSVVEVRGCPPLVVLDRVPVDTTPPWWIDDLITPSALEAVEVYRGAETPIEYQRSAPRGSGGSLARSGCGVIMLWSREPTVAGGKLLPSWKMILGGAAFAVGAFLATH